MNIIIAPVITEKSESLKENNVYVFKVAKKANKTQIKNEIEKAFGVKVANVNTVNAVQKKRRVGRYTGLSTAYKKAYVKLAELSDAFDYNFDILPTYQHIGWYRQANNRWPITAAKNMAGGNGFNGLPVIQMSYQFTDNNNNVSVGNTTDCYTTMFDIYRGAKDDADSYYPSVET